jgi:enoyl-CoA hydratase/carnithine racemase
MADGQVRVEVADGVALLVADRPGRLNAFDSAMVASLVAAIDRVESDPSVRVAILTGAGDRAFIAGGDVMEMRDLPQSEARRFVTAGQGMTLRVERCAVPVIAAVNGIALGGGTEIALACDLRIAAESAVFGFPEVGLGLLPGWGGTQRAIRALPLGVATELVLTGRRVGADEALRIGLVQRVVPAAELLASARELATAIAKNSPAAVRQAKRALRAGAGLPIDAALEAEAEAWIELVAHPDRREGLSALLEKRPPRWA